MFLNKASEMEARKSFIFRLWPVILTAVLLGGQSFFSWAEFSVSQPLREVACTVEKVDSFNKAIIVSKEKIYPVYRQDRQIALQVKEESEIRRRSEAISIFRVMPGEAGTARYFINEKGKAVLIDLYLD